MNCNLWEMRSYVHVQTIEVQIVRLNENTLAVCDRLIKKRMFWTWLYLITFAFCWAKSQLFRIHYKRKYTDSLFFKKFLMPAFKSKYLPISCEWILNPVFPVNFPFLTVKIRKIWLRNRRIYDILFGTPVSLVITF